MNEDDYIYEHFFVSQGGMKRILLGMVTAVLLLGLIGYAYGQEKSLQDKVIKEWQQVSYNPSGREYLGTEFSKNCYSLGQNSYRR